MRRRDLLLTATVVMAAPRCLSAQQKAMPVIGWLSSGSPDPFAPLVVAFGKGLSETG